VFNFLRSYYGVVGAKALRKLARFSPGAGVALDGAEVVRDAALLGGSELWAPVAGGAAVVATPSARERARWYRHRLSAVSSNTPVLSCFGLHEWAMQYRPEGAPYPPSSAFQSLPLRVPQATINATVEARGVNCTHFDAMRFFAPAAAPLSRHHPPARPLARDERRALDLRDNPACLHAAMDLFQISSRLQPLVPSALLLEALRVALAARTIDVRASPYDARQLGEAEFQPIAIETAAGKREYVEAQRGIMAEAQRVRAALVASLDDALRQEQEPEQLLRLSAAVC
jgi:hypothetical protein